MRIQLSLLFFALIPMMGFGQINSSIDFVAGVDESYIRLPEPDNNLATEILDSLSQRKVSWRVGFNYNKKIGSKLFFKTGLRLANVGYTSPVVLLTFDLFTPNNTDNNGWGDILNTNIFNNPNVARITLEPTNRILKTNYLFVEIPIAARFEFNDEKLAPFFEVGVSPSYHLATKTKLIDTETNETTISSIKEGDSFNRLQLVGTASFGVNYLISDNIQLFGQSIFRYHLTKTRDSEIKEHLYNYGLEIGVRKKLN